MGCFVHEATLKGTQPAAMRSPEINSRCRAHPCPYLIRLFANWQKKSRLKGGI